MREIKRLNLNNLVVAKKVIELFQHTDGKQSVTHASDKRLNELLADNNFFILAVFENETIVGGLTAYLIKMYKRGYTKVILYEIGVSENHRRKGIGTQLIEQLKMLSKQSNVEQILIPTTKSNIEAMTFYESINAVKDENNILLKLSDKL